MAWDAKNLDLAGRTAVVTGANTGLGLEIARQLAGAGAAVTLACRHAGRAADAKKDLLRSHPDAHVTTGAIDLASLASVQAFADTFAAEHRRLDLLVNNAGVMGVDRSRTVDGFETHFGVNHLGHFALTQCLLPLLLSTKGSRVGTMTSMGANLGWMRFDDLMFDGTYRRWQAYAQSKLANMLFTKALQQRLSRAGADTIAVAAHPGASHTELGYGESGFVNKLLPIFVPLVAQSAESGARPMVQALTDPEAQPGGLYGPKYHWFGHPSKGHPAPQARIGRDADRLWDLSVELTGVDGFAAAEVSAA